MNELIKELAEQANGPNPFFGLLKGQMVLLGDNAVEKFAELIVQECISTIANAENGYRDYRSQIEDDMLYHCIWLIKNKFGVEE